MSVRVLALSRGSFSRQTTTTTTTIVNGCQWFFPFVSSLTTAFFVAVHITCRRGLPRVPPASPPLDSPPPPHTHRLRMFFAACQLNSAALLCVPTFVPQYCSMLLSHIFVPHVCSILLFHILVPCFFVRMSFRILCHNFCFVHVFCSVSVPYFVPYFLFHVSVPCVCSMLFVPQFCSSFFRLNYCFVHSCLLFVPCLLEFMLSLLC